MITDGLGLIVCDRPQCRGFSESDDFSKTGVSPGLWPLLLATRVLQQRCKTLAARDEDHNPAGLCGPLSIRSISGTWLITRSHQLVPLLWASKEFPKKQCLSEHAGCGETSTYEKRWNAFDEPDLAGILVMAY